MEKNNVKLQYFTVICDTGKKDKILTLLQEHHAHGVTVIYGHGSAQKGLLAQAFGLDTEVKKAVISCLIPTEYAAALMEILKTKYRFTDENTGIAFSFCVEGLLF